MTISQTRRRETRIKVLTYNSKFFFGRDSMPVKIFSPCFSESLCMGPSLVMSDRINVCPIEKEFMDIGKKGAFGRQIHP